MALLTALRQLRPLLCQHGLMQPALQQHIPASAALQLTSLQPAAWRGVASSPAPRGLDEFFDTPDKDGQAPSAGRAWTAKDLRGKSWDDLHKLWYVLLKERNMLHTEKLRARAAGQKLPNPFRLQKVRRGMARIKHVLGERAIAEPDAYKSAELKRFIDAI